MRSGPSAEVLIPTYDRAASLKRTLTSLERQTAPAEVCVIDNGSADRTLTMLTSEFPWVRTVELPANAGFGVAVNAGAATSAADLLVVLNNDAVADARFIEELLGAFEAGGAEMICACLRQPDGMIESLGVEVDRSLVAYDARYGQPYPPPVTATQPEPLGPSGGAGAYAREAFLAAGGFDEEIFAYLEDVELAIRLRAAGLRCSVAERAWVTHEHSATLGSGSPAKNRLMGASRAYLLWKHGARLGVADRVRGAAIDAVVYGGQLLSDRNAQAILGRLSMRRSLRGRPRPPGLALSQIPVVDRPIGEALAIRRARRSPARSR